MSEDAIAMMNELSGQKMEIKKLREQNAKLQESCDSIVGIKGELGRQIAELREQVKDRNDAIALVEAENDKLRATIERVRRLHAATHELVGSHGQQMWSSQAHCCVQKRDIDKALDEDNITKSVLGDDKVPQ